MRSCVVLLITMSLAGCVDPAIEPLDAGVSGLEAVGLARETAMAWNADAELWRIEGFESNATADDLDECARAPAYRYGDGRALCWTTLWATPDGQLYNVTLANTGQVIHNGTESRVIDHVPPTQLPMDSTEALAIIQASELGAEAFAGKGAMENAALYVNQTQDEFPTIGWYWAAAVFTESGMYAFAVDATSGDITASERFEWPGPIGGMADYGRVNGNLILGQVADEEILLDEGHMELGIRIDLMRGEPGSALDVSVTLPNGTVIEQRVDAPGTAGHEVILVEFAPMGTYDVSLQLDGAYADYQVDWCTSGPFVAGGPLGPAHPCNRVRA